MGRRAGGTATIRALEANTVAAEKPNRARVGKRSKRNATPKAATTQPPPERQFVDIDPWAVLLEQLMEVPGEEPPTGKGTKGK
jgi:hypothetical protein